MIYYFTTHKIYSDWKLPNVKELQSKRYWAWYVAFGYAVDGNGEDSHGAGAVWYDTKVEDALQGEDAERVYNYV